MPRRSVLLSPADEPEMCEKAAATDADVACFDLEDGVAPSQKVTAREAVRSVLDSVDREGEAWLRVNADPEAQRADLRAALDGVSVDAVVLPKASGPDDVETLARRLAERDVTAPVVALIESAAGVVNAAAIAAAGATTALVYGDEDLSADLGATVTGEGGSGPLSYPREHVLVAARAAGVDAIDTHYPDYADEEGLRAVAERALELGYDGKLAIHPRQVEVIHEAFTPAPERVEWAEGVLGAVEGSDGDEAAVFVVDGEMIDAPQIRRARRILERAGPAEDG